jgi:hypothetical protein
MTSLYFEGALDDHHLEEFADHVVTCSACEKRLLSEAKNENIAPQKTSA